MWHLPTAVVDRLLVDIRVVRDTATFLVLQIKTLALGAAETSVGTHVEVPRQATCHALPAIVVGPLHRAVLHWLLALGCWHLPHIVDHLRTGHVDLLDADVLAGHIHVGLWAGEASQEGEIVVVDPICRAGRALVTLGEGTLCGALLLYVALLQQVLQVGLVVLLGLCTVDVVAVVGVRDQHCFGRRRGRCRLAGVADAGFSGGEVASQESGLQGDLLVAGTAGLHLQLIRDGFQIYLGLGNTPQQLLFLLLSHLITHRRCWQLHAEYLASLQYNTCLQCRLLQPGITPNHTDICIDLLHQGQQLIDLAQQP